MQRKNAPHGAQITSRRQPWLRRGLIVLMLVLTGCGGGSDDQDSGPEGTTPGSGSPSADRGEVVLALTDAEGDFLTYTVDVASLTLLREDGMEVQAIPAVARVDFAQYRTLTEFVAAIAAPPGRYTGLRMVLDFTNADIQLEVNGMPVKAIVQDTGGNGLATLETHVELDNQRPLQVAPQTTSHLSMDFDLDASNLVDIVSSPPVVKVDPVLIADIEPENLTLHRVRGVVAGFQRERDTYQLRLRPFHAQEGDFGTLTVYTTTATLFDVNGRASTGTGGEIMLGGLDSATPVVTLGELNPSSRRFVATVVYAGSSVPGVELDGVTGHVTARSGDQLTLRGATVAGRDGAVAHGKEVSVRLASDTPVRREGEYVINPSADAISVGQRVTALGALNNATPDMISLDATSGLVRLHVTEIEGDAVSHAAGELVVNVQHIDDRNVGAFDFSNTGASLAEHADPQFYQIDVGTLNLAGVAAGDPVRVQGFVNGIGRAPPDFNATRVDRLDPGAGARLSLNWDPAANAPLLTSDRQSIALSIENMGAQRYVVSRGVTTDLAALGAPTLRADRDGMGMFAIKEGRSVQVFRRFADFSASLAGRLDGTTVAQRVAAAGQFDDESRTLITRRAAVMLISP